MKRTLSLKREALAELSTRELSGVAGGALPTTPIEACTVFNSQVFCSGGCYTRGTTCAC